MTSPVLIVGAGPTGLTAALELSRMGVDVRLVDRREAPATTSRAIGVQARTLELLDQRGLADELVGLGNKGLFGSVYGGGARILHLDFAHVGSPFPYLLFVSQAQTERVLREACLKNGVVPEWGVELIALSQDAKSHDAAPARAVLRHRDGRLEEAAAPWLISTEGAHSLVRTTLDLQFEGHTREERYALGDLRIEGALADTDFHIFSSEHGFMGLFPMGGDHFRLIASHPMGGGSGGEAPSLALIQAIYDERSHIPARFHDMTWSSWFTINSRMVSRLKAGRLFLGGDAAHIHSPAGAQGMNTGIQDMVNLAWKLAGTISGRLQSGILETYADERLPVMRTVLSGTDRLTDVIGSENPLLRSAVDVAGRLLGDTTFVQERQTAGISQLALGYRGGPLSVHHRTGGTLHAGDRVPDVAVRRRAGDGSWIETTLHETLDPSAFTTLIVERDGSPDNDLADRNGLARETIGEVRRISASRLPSSGQSLDHVAIPGSLVLVRPDGYAALAASTASSTAALETFRGKWLIDD